jgi:Ser/Thr protein kinase RdoA (MazF antagonist)
MALMTVTMLQINMSTQQVFKVHRQRSVRVLKIKEAEMKNVLLLSFNLLVAVVMACQPVGHYGQINAQAG